MLSSIRSLNTWLSVICHRAAANIRAFSQPVILPSPGKMTCNHENPKNIHFLSPDWCWKTMKQKTKKGSNLTLSSGVLKLMQSVLHGHFLRSDCMLHSQFIDRQWRKRCCLNLRRVTACTTEMRVEFVYVALWFQGDFRHAATCAAHSTKEHLLCCDHAQGQAEGQWNVETF